MKRPVIIALTVATIIKLLLAWFTIGTSDVETWRTFAENAARCGSCAYYLSGPYGDPFNHPPFIILFLKLLANLAPFPFWLRLPSIIADIGAVVLVSRLLPNVSKWLLVILAINPVSILISGFHGNTDPVMIFFVVAGIYAATRDHWAISGVLFGISLNIKIVPLMLVPCFLFYALDLRKRLAFASGAALIVVIASLLYIGETRTIITSVLGYKGLYVNWGPTHYFNIFGKAPLHFFAAPMRYAIIIGSLILSWWLSREGRSLFEICASVILLFYVLTPAIGLQYFAWGVPFVIALGFARSSFYYGIAGALIALQYHRWSHGLWYFADSHSVASVTAETEFLSFALWATCGVLLWRTVTKRSRTSYLDSSDRRADRVSNVCV